MGIAWYFFWDSISIFFHFFWLDSDTAFRNGAPTVTGIVLWPESSIGFNLLRAKTASDRNSIIAIIIIIIDKLNFVALYFIDRSH